MLSLSIATRGATRVLAKARAPLRSGCPCHPLLCCRPRFPAARRTTFLRITTKTGAQLAVTPGHYVFARPAAAAAEGVAVAGRRLLAAPADPAATLHATVGSAPLPLSTWRYVLPETLAAGDWTPVHVATEGGHRTRPERILSVEPFKDTGIYMCVGL